MSSQLSFDATKVFRDKLITKNLKPYKVDGSRNFFTEPQNYETVLRDSNVIDSPDELISNNKFVDQLGTKNVFNPEGGFLKTINYNNLIVRSDTNQGPYPNFNVTNTYTPYNIVFGTNTSSLSQDSTLQQIGAKRLKSSFEERVASEIQQRTVGSANFLSALNDPVLAVQILKGTVPAFAPNYQITQAANPAVSAVDLSLRLAGTYFPASTIPGAYFQSDIENPNLSQQIARSFNTGLRTLGGLFGLKLNSLNNNPSQIFINNTGFWTRERILFNLDLNKFRPGYTRGIVGDIVGSVVGSDQSSFYVGSNKNDPSLITSPVGQIPVNEFGEPVRAIVYGPDRLAREYEGQNFNFGLAGKSSSESNGSMDGGFTWTSEKYVGNAGYNVKRGGEIGSEDPEFNSIRSTYEKNISSNLQFKPGSILDETQRLINSQPDGSARLAHVGNAIDQVSKVFNDGYKEITKGSKVKSFVNDSGENKIINKKPLKEKEYCRLFTKDVPYLTYNDLQKKDKLYRSFESLASYSVMDSVYNLNIAPVKTSFMQSNTNVVGTESTRNVKKYMFSIENLAWRTSNRQGYRVSDLPDCEKGPNGGRIMWFPPYNLTFSETVNPSWQPTTFLGRPEPVYTYKDTTRTGTIGFSIVVDHPSILNLIVNKYLEKADSATVDSIVNSFFAGCIKYDLYELAKIYNTIEPDKLLQIQGILQTTNSSEIVYDTITEIQDIKPSDDQPVTSTIKFDEFVGFSFYFDNDIPRSNANPILNYRTYYNTYKTKKPDYKNNAATFFSDVIINNFEDVIDKDGGLRKKISDALTADKEAKIKITLIGSASSPAEVEYNRELGKRRVKSVEEYLKTDSNGVTGLAEFINQRRLIIVSETQGEERVIPVNSPNNNNSDAVLGKEKEKNYIGDPIDCSKDLTGLNKITSVNAAACRAVRIKDIQFSPPPKKEKPPVREEKTRQVPRVVNKGKTRLPPTDYKGITKKVIRLLLSECDYFKMLENETPMIYKSMKEKIKYFNPTFHSTTPEGLNSRLTFLQQCTRPGDTIPTINQDGTLSNNDAYNTAFGSPPVLVLRIGDFYNTKVLCTSLNISYDPLLYDLNPEGIGVQPMIAKITMGVTFIGGSGLKEPIEQLQNALSFNYYANTEIYDERAEDTEGFTGDKLFFNLLKEDYETKNKEEAAQPKNELQNAIGVLTQTSPTGGTINYKEIMNKLADSTNTYIKSTFNKLEELTNSTNYGILQLFNEKRNYKSGNFLYFSSNELETDFFGKSSEYDKLLFQAREELIKQIREDDLPIQDELEKTKNVTDVDLRNFKVNLIKYLNDKIYSDISNKMKATDESIVSSSMNLIKNIDMLNYVQTLRDGKVDEKGFPTVYSITADTSTITTFENDFKAVSSGMTLFIKNLKQDSILTEKTYDDGDDYKTYVEDKISIPNSKSTVSFSEKYEKLFHLFFSQAVIKDLEGLFEFLTKSPVPTTQLSSDRLNTYNTFKSAVRNSLEARKKLYESEQKVATDRFKNKPGYKTDFTFFSKNVTNVERVYKYELNNNASNDDKIRLLNILYVTNNWNTDKKVFNGKKRLT